MSSVALVAEASGSAPQWSRELGISGEVHEGLLCEVGSTVTFTTHAGPGSKLRVRCALLPRDWETSSASVEFKDMHTNKVIWSNPSMQYREEFALNPTSAVDTNTFLGQDINARERMANEFARALVSAILEAF